MFTKILVGYDGTPHSDAALGVALDLARKYKAQLHAAAVARLPDFAATVGEVQAAIDQAEERYGEALGRAEKRARQARVRLQTHLLKGHEAKAILDFVGREGCDLIVIGARPLSTVQRYLLGGLSEALARYCGCPVLVVKGPAKLRA